MLPEDFISLARHDLRQNGSKPSQVALRRAPGAVYYAMFHTLAKTGADLLIGESSVFRNKHAWQRTYRGLNHGRTKAACRNQDTMSQFSLPIRNLAVSLSKCRGFAIALTMTRMPNLVNLLQNTWSRCNSDISHAINLDSSNAVFWSARGIV